MVESNSVKLNIISTQNPIIINAKNHWDNKGFGRSRKSKRIEIEDFSWVGTFPKNYKSLTLDGVDTGNIPPNFFFFVVDTGISDGVFDKDGNPSNVVEFAHPTYTFENFATLKGTTVAEATSGGYSSFDMPGGNTFDQWESPTINSAVLTYSHSKIVYEINSDQTDGFDMGNLAGSQLKIYIMANMNILSKRKNSSPSITEDTFEPRNITYNFADRFVGGLGNVSEEYVLRVRIFDVEPLDD